MGYYALYMLPPPSNHGVPLRGFPVCDVQLRGLTAQQKASCRAALEAFLNRHGLAYWGLIVDITEAGPGAWELEVSGVAPIELDFPIRTNQLKVDQTVNLARVVDLCLETHYHACMNRKAAAHSSR